MMTPDKKIKPKLLILDLDETLIHAIKRPLEHAPDFEAEGYCVYERPGVREFLAAAEKDFSVAIWSSAWRPYVQKIAERLIDEQFELVFLWGRERCTARRDLTFDEWFFAKDLRKVKRKGWKLEDILIVDDEPRKVRKNYGNAIYVRPFDGDPDDRELPLLSEYLKAIRFEPNFRKIEKRGWRSQLNILRG